VPNKDEERQSYNSLIGVLEEAVEKAAKALGPEARMSYRESRITIHNASEIYEYLCDLLDEALAARSRLD